LFDLRTVEVDHRVHGLRAGAGLRDVLLLDDLDAGNLLQGLGGDRMGLIPPEIIAWSHVDDTDRDVVGGAGDAGAGAGYSGGCYLKEATARKRQPGHDVVPMRFLGCAVARLNFVERASAVPRTGPLAYGIHGIDSGDRHFLRSSSRV
jgi:hypothetical protein